MYFLTESSFAQQQSSQFRSSNIEPDSELRDFSLMTACASKNVKCMLGVTISRRTRPGSRSSSSSPRGKFLIISHRAKIASLFSFFSFCKDKNRYFTLLLFFQPYYIHGCIYIYIYLSRNNGRNWISVSGIVRRLIGFSRDCTLEHANFHRGLNCFKYRTCDNNS